MTDASEGAVDPLVAPGPCRVIRAGVVPYPAAEDELRRLQDLRKADRIGDTVVMLEHPEIVTAGRRLKRDGVPLPSEYPTHVTDRGGGLTWHGPGQLVVYPVVRWTGRGERGVAVVIDRLEDWVIAALERLGVAGGRDGRMRGVWAGGFKVCSIGLSFSHWISRHGLSINYATPPGRVESLAGCNLPPGTTTSIDRAAGVRLTRVELEDALLAAMPTAIGRTALPIDVSRSPPWLEAVLL